MLPEHPRDDISQILKQMEAVGDLYGVTSGPLSRFGVLSATVPAHHLEPRMLRKSPGERIRPPVGQNVHQSVTLKIHKYGSVAVPRRKATSSTLNTLGVS